MRASPGARDCALRLARAGTIGLALALSGCPYAAPRHAPERKTPPRVLVVRLEQVSLRASAWVELHSWLAASARASTEPPGAPRAGDGAGEQAGDGAIDGAVRAYATALADDERDEALARTMNALDACEDERCARAAASGSPFADAYAAALPSFLSGRWAERAEVTRAGIDVARSAFGEEVDALVARLAQDLAIDWPAVPPAVPMVAHAPETGRAALIRPVLAARSACFAKERNDTERMHDARIVDCVLGYAALRLDARSTLAVALGRELAARGKTSELARAWTALVVHAVAVTVSGWEPKHASVLRRSAVAVLPEPMEWLAREWPSRVRGEGVTDFARRYAEQL